MPAADIAARPATRRAGCFAAAAGALLLAACAQIVDSTPINDGLPMERPAAGDPLLQDDDPEIALGLAFSGGGHRAAAFSYGVLRALEDIKLPDGRPMIDVVDLVAGVSGGSVTASYFALKGRDGYRDLYERFLLRDAEAAFSTAISLPNLLTVAQVGGANSARAFAGWLDEALLEGATFGDLARRRRGAQLWISASDLYNRVPFVFSREVFRALCSDLDRVPLASAVSASAAFPVAFAPVNVESFSDSCRTPLPPWVHRAARDHEGSSLRRSLARALERYRDPDVIRYVKLSDGGLTDNFGLKGLAIAHGGGDAPTTPFSPAIAAKLRRGLFLVVNAGRGPAGNWALERQGPDGKTTVEALADTAIDASTMAGYDHFQLTVAKWRERLVAWRCALSPAEVRRLTGGRPGWNCRDVQFFVGEVSFVDAGPEREATLNQVPTRFRLPAEQVDFVIESGNIALRREPTVQRFLNSLGARATSGARIVAQ